MKNDNVSRESCEAPLRPMDTSDCYLPRRGMSKLTIGIICFVAGAAVTLYGLKKYHESLIMQGLPAPEGRLFEPYRRDDGAIKRPEDLHRKDEGNEWKGNPLDEKRSQYIV